MTTQRGWTGCHHCLTLFFSGWPPPPPTPEKPYNPAPNGSCPVAPAAAEGQHVPNFDWAFELTTDPSNRGDEVFVSGWTSGFFRCTACEAVFTEGAGGNLCPALPDHNRGESYHFPTDWGPNERFKRGWKVCGKCGVMFFVGGSGNDFDGACPSGATHHAVSVDFGVEHWL